MRALRAARALEGRHHHFAAGNVIGTNLWEVVASLAARAAASSRSMKISANMACSLGVRTPVSLDGSG